MGYAKGTTVSVERTRAEIETLLRRYGADQFVSGWETRRAMVGFRAHSKHVRLTLELPDPKDKMFESKRRTHRRSFFNAATQKREYTMVGASGDRYEAEVRRRWRALLLVLKAKLEAVASGITSFEDEFLAHIMLPGGKTVGQHVVPAIEAAYTTGKLPALMPGIGEP